MGDEQHAYLILTNEDTGDKDILEGMPENMEMGVIAGLVGLAMGDNGENLRKGVGWGKLVKEKVRTPTDASKENKIKINTPAGLTDGDFQKKLIKAYNCYQNDIEYSPFPFIDKANSNSLIGSILRFAGSNYKPEPGRNVPGWNQDLFEIKKQFK